MGLFSRIVSGVSRAVTAPLRAAATPFTATFNELKTVLGSAKQLITLHPINACKELIGGTVSNACRAGVNLAEGGMPALAFAEGFARDKGMSPFTSGSGLGLT